MRYSCCAEAYNTVLDTWKNLTSNILFFVHQDIYFSSSAFIDAAAKYIQDGCNVILGVAGMPTAGRVVSNLKYYNSQEYITVTRVQEESVEVQSLDECCFALSKSLFSKIGFDDYVCNHWHLYAVDLCYSAREFEKTTSLVLKESEFVCHKYDNSGGMYADNHFLWSLIKLMRKFKRHKRIYTPCLIVDNTLVSGGQRLLKSFLKNIFRKIK